MKQLLLIIVSIFCINVGYNQDTIRLKHTNYTTIFNKQKHYPVRVEWWETRARVGCKNPLKRKDSFKPDPLLPFETDIAKYYVGSGLDRGHMCPAADNECSVPQIEAECFYFSNMAPQYHSLNAGDWKTLETLTRTLALKQDSIKVWAGNTGEIKKIGEVSIPLLCWKVLYIKTTGEYQAYIFTNTPNKPNGLPAHKTTLQAVELLTGFKFK